MMKGSVFERFSYNFEVAQHRKVGICSFGIDANGQKFHEESQTRGDIVDQDITHLIAPFLGKIKEAASSYGIFVLQNRNLSVLLQKSKAKSDYLLELYVLSIIVNTHSEIWSLKFWTNEQIYSDGDFRQLLIPINGENNHNCLNGLIDFKHIAIIGRAHARLSNYPYTSLAKKPTEVIARMCGVSPEIIEPDPEMTKKAKQIAYDFLKKVFF